MQTVGLPLLVIVVVGLLAAILYWAVVLQPKAERKLGALTGEAAWKASGLEECAGQGFSLFQIVPTPRMTTAEFRFQDEAGFAIAKYIGNSKKRGTLEFGGRKATLYIQGAPLGGSAFAGKVGGTTDDSIVIRDDAHLIAEAWRTKILPPVRFRCDYRGERYEITGVGWWGAGAGAVTRNGEHVGAICRPALGSRNLFLVLRRDLPEELKICLCSIALLQ